MRFELRPDSDKAPGKRKAPNYFSTSVRLRLATLVVLLGLVLIAMNEAGKPATWERIGFRSANPEIQAVVQKKDEDHTGTNLESSSQRVTEFWQDAFRDFSYDERTNLYAILGAVQNPEPVSDAYQNYAEKLLSKIRQRFARNEKLSASEVDRQTFQRTVNSLSRALEGNLDDAESKSEIIALVNLLDDLAYEMVEDRTSMNQSDERLAWQRTWQRLSTAESDAFVDVSYIQLAGQPSAYRGKLIRVRGEVQGMQRLASGGDENSKPYIVLWVKPVDSNHTPYCVYVWSVPEAFPIPDTTFQKIQEPVIINGVFFKLRSYLAINRKIETCPLILAETVQHTPVAVPDASVKWRPPGWALASFFIAMPIIAAWLAIGVYRSTSFPRRYSGRSDPSEVENSLKTLAHDPGVKTDRDKVQELYERDRSDD